MFDVSHPQYYDVLQYLAPTNEKSYRLGYGSTMEWKDVPLVTEEDQPSNKSVGSDPTDTRDSTVSYREQT